MEEENLTKLFRTVFQDMDTLILIKGQQVTEVFPIMVKLKRVSESKQTWYLSSNTSIQIKTTGSTAKYSKDLYAKSTKLLLNILILTMKATVQKSL